MTCSRKPLCTHPFQFSPLEEILKRLNDSDDGPNSEIPTPVLTGSRTLNRRPIDLLMVNSTTRHSGLKLPGPRAPGPMLFDTMQKTEWKAAPLKEHIAYKVTAKWGAGSRNFQKLRKFLPSPSLDSTFFVQDNGSLHRPWLDGDFQKPRRPFLFHELK